MLPGSTNYFERSFVRWWQASSYFINTNKHKLASLKTFRNKNGLGRLASIDLYQVAHIVFARSLSKKRLWSIVWESFEGSKNSPGSLRACPYTNSAGEQLRSSLTDARIPSKTIGSSVLQCIVSPRALSEDLSCLWNRSIIPFACGWYAVVRIRF